MSLVGLMIQVASRICFNSSAAAPGSPNSGSAVMLLEHLDCPLLKEFRIWEIYFLYRINRNKSVLNVHNKNHFLCKFSVNLDHLDSNEKRIRLPDPQFRHIVKIVKEGEGLHNVALKEIAYYLIFLKNVSEKSTEILMKIYVKYSLDKQMMEGILLVHKTSSCRYIQEKIGGLVYKNALGQPMEMRRKASSSIDPNKLREIGLDTVLSSCLQFLSPTERLSLLLLSKTLCKRLQTKVLDTILSQPAGVSTQARISIYKSLIPQRFVKHQLKQVYELSMREDNKDIIKLDLNRTCKEDPDVYEVEDPQPR